MRAVVQCANPSVPGEASNGNTLPGAALGDADFQGCRWIEGEPLPLHHGMYCGRPVVAGDSWCALHRGIAFRSDWPQLGAGTVRR